LSSWAAFLFLFTGIAGQKNYFTFINLFLANLFSTCNFVQPFLPGQLLIGAGMNNEGHVQKIVFQRVSPSFYLLAYYLAFSKPAIKKQIIFYEKS